MYTSLSSSTTCELVFVDENNYGKYRFEEVNMVKSPRNMITHREYSRAIVKLLSAYI